MSLDISVLDQSNNATTPPKAVNGKYHFIASGDFGGGSLSCFIDGVPMTDAVFTQPTERIVTMKGNFHVVFSGATNGSLTVVLNRILSA